MSTHNNSLQYYKTYYQGNIEWIEESNGDKREKERRKEVNKNHFAAQNEKIFASRLPAPQDVWRYPSQGLYTIPLVTTYPGLLLGSGLSHGSGLMGELKLGFFLDYSTGLPLIPGSSVKGVLRSAFPQLYLKEGHKEKAGQILQLAQYYLKTVTNQDWPEKAVLRLETFLFGSADPGNDKNAVPGTTIFHDALPVNADRVRINGSHTHQYLADDYITPHKKPLKNPVPIAFLKVLSGVEFQFQFALKAFPAKAKDDTEYRLDEGQQKELFELILLDLGVGAKTNVGYGQFLTPDVWKVRYGAAQKSHDRQDRHKPSEQHKEKKDNPPPSPKTQPPTPKNDKELLPVQYHHKDLLKANTPLTGIICEGSKKKPEVKRILFVVMNNECLLTSEDIQHFDIGDLIKAIAQPTTLRDRVSTFGNPVKL